MEQVVIFNVDDYEPARYARSKLLRSVGFEVREAGTGREALRLAMMDPPTLMILDVNLPDMSGLDVCRQLKTNTVTAAIPILQTSATFTGAADRAQGLDSGADAYLTEPVDASVLLATVNALLRVRRAEGELRASIEREQRARAAAEAAYRSKEEFIAVLAHELRSPLAPIRLAMHTLRPQAAGDPDVQRAITVVERQVRHLARLLDDLLDASRLTRERIELRKMTVSLQTVVTDALEDARGIIETRRHTVALDMPPAALWLEADPTRLTQVVTNLLNNAAKYTPPGGTISVIVEQDADHAVLRVRDTGVGIAKDMLGRIFDLFTQGAPAMVREGGLGIGLALAQTLVERHGGTLTAASEGPGTGSEFVVRLPIGATRETFASEPGMPEAPPCRRVLIIEDNDDTREVMRVALELDGHTVETAGTGADGVAMARASSPDVVIVDIALPDRDGYDIAQELRETLGERALLVALTGYGHRDDARAGVAGFDAYLVKPAMYEDLSRLLAEWKRPT
jgi:signal transduction histidine kinase